MFGWELGQQRREDGYEKMFQLFQERQQGRGPDWGSQHGQDVYRDLLEESKQGDVYF